MFAARSRTCTGLGLAALLVLTFAQAAPDLRAESVPGNGEVLLKIVNISRETLLVWLPGCGLAVQLRLDGEAVPSTRACGFSLAQRPQLLLPGDFVLERRPVTFPSRHTRLTQTVSLTYSRDPRSDAERAAQGQPLPAPACQGIPCPRPRWAGLEPDDPLNPANFPRLHVTLSTPPLEVGQP